MDRARHSVATNAAPEPDPDAPDEVDVLTAGDGNNERHA